MTTISAAPVPLRNAVRTVFGEAALVQRCQVHTTRNILECVSERDRLGVTMQTRIGRAILPCRQPAAAERGACRIRP